MAVDAAAHVHATPTPKHPTHPAHPIPPADTSNIDAEMMAAPDASVEAAGSAFTLSTPPVSTNNFLIGKDPPDPATPPAFPQAFPPDTAHMPPTSAPVFLFNTPSGVAPEIAPARRAAGETLSGPDFFLPAAPKPKHPFVAFEARHFAANRQYIRCMNCRRGAGGMVSHGTSGNDTQCGFARLQLRCTCAKSVAYGKALVQSGPQGARALAELREELEKWPVVAKVAKAPARVSASRKPRAATDPSQGSIALFLGGARKRVRAIVGSDNEDEMGGVAVGAEKEFKRGVYPGGLASADTAPPPVSYAAAATHTTRPLAPFAPTLPALASTAGGLSMPALVLTSAAAASPAQSLQRPTAQPLQTNATRPLNTSLVNERGGEGDGERSEEGEITSTPSSVYVNTHTQRKGKGRAISAVGDAAAVPTWVLQQHAELPALVVGGLPLTAAWGKAGEGQLGGPLTLGASQAVTAAAHQQGSHALRDPPAYGVGPTGEHNPMVRPALGTPEDEILRNEVIFLRANQVALQETVARLLEEMAALREELRGRRAAETPQLPREALAPPQHTRAILQASQASHNTNRGNGVGGRIVPGDPGNPKPAQPAMYEKDPMPPRPVLPGNAEWEGPVTMPPHPVRPGNAEWEGPVTMPPHLVLPRYAEWEEHVKMRKLQAARAPQPAAVHPSSQHPAQQPAERHAAPEPQHPILPGNAEWIPILRHVAGRKAGAARAPQPAGTQAFGQPPAHRPAEGRPALTVRDLQRRKADRAKAVAQALEPRVTPAEFTVLYMGVPDPRSILKAVGRERDLRVLNILRALGIAQLVSGASLMPGGKIQLVCRAGAAETVKEALAETNATLHNIADPFAQPPHSRQSCEKDLELTARHWPSSAT